MAAETIYPLWKVVAWRFLRAGLASGISSFIAVQVILSPDFDNFQVYATSLGSAFLAGFISGASLAARDYFGDKDRGEGVINKLPM